MTGKKLLKRLAFFLLLLAMVAMIGRFADLTEDVTGGFPDVTVTQKPGGSDDPENPGDSDDPGSSGNSGSIYLDRGVIVF